MVLLHGLLDVDIYEGRHIPASLTTKATGTLKKIICCGAGPALLGSNDPYLALDVGDTRRLRSSFCRSTHHPQWNERAEVFLADEAEEITIYVKDAAIIGSDYLGQAKLPVSSILDGREFDGWLQLTDQNGKPVGHSERLGGEFHQAAVKLTIRFTPIIPEDGPLGEVPRTYFPMRHGNKVTLYHDSVATPGPVHDIRLAKARSYEEHSCWDDMYEAILQAKRFIWIAGWSVWVKTRLQRKPDRKENSPTMGELLIQKAKQGVTVLLLVWDDRSNNLGLHPGLMSTHDNETYTFFRRTKVTCVVAGRTGGMEDTFLQNQFNRNLFTHHQKTVVMDAPMPGQPNTTHDEPPPSSSSSSSSDSSGHDAGGQPGQKPTRRVIAFIGGLDLTDGRYDRHDHPLFETCGPGGPHCEDFYQACVEGFDSNRSCVRQPWHDLHSKVEGQIAMDICLNFIERWVEQAGKRKLAKIRHLGAHHDLLLPKGFEKFASKKETVKSKVSDEHMHHKAHIIKEHHPELNVKNPHHAESWAVQLFRSIDSDSASGFPKMSAGGYEAGLNVGKGKVIDKSIHDAYVHLIRRSKRYLYLENQYFLGGAHMWDSDKDTPAYNQIPVEIALKIASKIKAGEPFRAYIVIPMYPEGVPTSGSSQAILYYQSQTRRMMYRIVAQAIKEAGIEAHPTDYLQFFCLVKREGPETSQNLTDPQQDSPHASAPAGDKQHSSSTGARISSIRAHLPHLGGTDGGGLHGAKGDRSGMPYGQQKGKHRDKHSGNSVGPATLPPADPDTAQHRCTEARRFMIYVHSKMIVVDDEYVLLGSANINQRSLDGARDSEICIGAYQEGYTMNKPGDDLPRGQVSGFRRALWKEHIQELGPEHDDPSSLECMQSLRNIGNENWLAFKGEEVKWLPRGHLINYPIAVQVDGDVRPLGDCEEFPDLGGKIVGTKSAVLPGILTT